MTSSDATETGPQPESDVHFELSRVEAELSELRREAHDLRAQLADAGPMDSADRTVTITQADQLDALAAGLERRRAALLQKLGQSR
jgi:hypothetical protein